MDHRVVVVGAGPAGALLGYLLASRGVDTLLLERQTDFAREFRGEILMPSGLRALEDAGVSLDTVSTSTPERIEAFHNDHQFVDLSLEDLAPPLPMAVSQPELLEHLVALGERTGHLELWRGAAVRGVERESGKTRLRVKRTGEDREHELCTPFLIGADGRASVVRKRLAPRVRRTSLPMDVVWFKMPYPDWPEARGRVVLGRGHLMIAVRSPDGLFQVAWVILKGTYGELKSKDVATWVEEMADHADPELASHLRANAGALSRPFLLDAVSDRVVGWAQPGTLLVGDAAHTMSPVGGQGLNVALRDAIVAANALVPALRAERGVDAAAASVEAERAREVDLLQRLQALPPRLLLGRSLLHEWARRGVAALVGSGRVAARDRPPARFFLDGVSPVALRV
ncbi:MAG: FAD-dependent monooxygenase [Myxococcota bacterium]